MAIPDSPITLTAYAKRRGVSKMAVSRAVKLGRLVESVVRDARGVPSIRDPDLADREWAANMDYTRAPARSAVAPLQVGPAPAGGAGAAPPPPPAPAEEDPPDAPPEGGWAESLATAAARQKHWAAQLAELKYREAAKELIPAKDVERRLVDVLTSAKLQLLAIPSRARQALPHLTTGDLEVLEGILREALVDLRPGNP